MYQTIKIKTLSDFLETSQYEYYLDQARAYMTLCIFDVDGVFFDSMLGLDSILSVIKEEHLVPIREIGKSEAGMWVFTDRNRFGTWGKYQTQLKDALANTCHPALDAGSIAHFPSSEDFIKEFDFTKHKRAIITDAEKPSIYAEGVINIAMMNYDNILYFAGQDIPVSYHDRTLLEDLSRKEDTDKIIFFDVGRPF